MTRGNIDAIAALMLADINARLSDRRIRIELTDRAYAYIAENGFDPIYGARPLKRFMQKEVETLAARMILEGKIMDGGVITIDEQDGKLIGR